MRSKFARCLEMSWTLSHDSSLGLDESSAKIEPNLDALPVQVNAVSIYRRDVVWGLLLVDESAAKETVTVCYHDRQWLYVYNLGHVLNSVQDIKEQHISERCFLVIFTLCVLVLCL